METIKGYKGFNKDLTCKNFQYKEGEIFKTDSVKICESGFHFCTEPLDVLGYYDPANSVFHEVEGSGKSVTKNDDSKIAVSEIKIGAEIKLLDFIKLGVDVLLKRTDAKKIVNSGYRSASVNSGDGSASVNSGYRSASEVSGKNSVAIGLGVENKAKACLNSWIVLSEWDKSGNIKWIKTAKIDGKKLKADTFYQLKNGKFILAN